MPRFCTDNWDHTANPMKRDDFGVWECYVEPKQDGSCAIPHDSMIKVRRSIPVRDFEFSPRLTSALPFSPRVSRSHSPSPTDRPSTVFLPGSNVSLKTSPSPPSTTRDSGILLNPSNTRSRTSVLVRLRSPRKVD